MPSTPHKHSESLPSSPCCSAVCHCLRPNPNCNHLVPFAVVPSAVVHKRVIKAGPKRHWTTKAAKCVEHQGETLCSACLSQCRALGCCSRPTLLYRRCQEGAAARAPITWSCIPATKPRPIMASRRLSTLSSQGTPQAHRLQASLADAALPLSLTTFLNQMESEQIMEEAQSSRAGLQRLHPGLWCRSCGARLLHCCTSRRPHPFHSRPHCFPDGLLCRMPTFWTSKSSRN